MHNYHYSEMVIYRDNLSAIICYRLSLSLKFFFGRQASTSDRALTEIFGASAVDQGVDIDECTASVMSANRKRKETRSLLGQEIQVNQQKIISDENYFVMQWDGIVLKGFELFFFSICRHSRCSTFINVHILINSACAKDFCKCTITCLTLVCQNNNFCSYQFFCLLSFFFLQELSL